MRFLIEHVAKRFGAKEVLRDADFAFEEGKIYGLLGRNGAGKTTLFNCINRDIRVDAGGFFMEENGQRREPAAEDIGYVLSTPTVPEFLTGREFLKFFMDINRASIREPKTLDEYFDYMSIDPEDRDKLMKDYSHGMKNKMQMLVNIIAQPKLLLLDEPLTSLDVIVAEEMKELLRSLKRDRIILFSTHLMDLALDLCDEIVLLNHGTLERVEKANLDNEEFKERIIAALREDGTVHRGGYSQGQGHSNEDGHIQTGASSSAGISSQEKNSSQENMGEPDESGSLKKVRKLGKDNLREGRDV